MISLGCDFAIESEIGVYISTGVNVVLRIGHDVKGRSPGVQK
jgi:hypothetical protein